MVSSFQVSSLVMVGESSKLFLREVRMVGESSMYKMFMNYFAFFVVGHNIEFGMQEDEEGA